MRLDIRASHRHLLALAKSAFGGFLVPAPSERALSVTLLGRAEPRVTGGTAPTSSSTGIARPPPAWHRERGSLFVAGVQDSVVVAQLDSGEIVAFVRLGSDPPLGETQRAVLLESPVWRVAAWRGLTNVHAAAVRVNDCSLVLRGAAGAGKSTLAAAAAMAGHTLLAEEATWYDPTGGAPCLRGSPWRVRLDTSAIEQLGLRDRVAGQDLRPDAAGKWALDTVQALGAHVAEAMPPGPLVLLRRSSRGRSRWRPMRAEEARARFEAATTPGERTQDAQRWEAARESLLAHGAYELAAGAPAAAVGALEAIAAAWRTRGRDPAMEA